MNVLNDQGYIIIKNNTHKELFDEKMMYFYNNNKDVNYKLLHRFIDDDFFPILMNKINNNEKVFYNKFRFSNNNNSSDASTFHGDCYNHTNDEIINQYTCLYYFDDAEFEIIPETHKKSKYNGKNFIDAYNYKKRINIKGGTFIIIHSNIHHRGVNFKTTLNRRLLQIFDVNFNKRDYDLYSPRFIIIKTNESTIIKMINSFLFNFFKNNNNNFSENINYFHYYLVFNNIKYKYLFNSPNDKDQGKILSYEPGESYLLENSENVKKTNINIKCNKNIKNESPNTYFLQIYFLYLIIALLLLYLYINYKNIINKYILTFFKKNNFLKRK